MTPEILIIREDNEYRILHGHLRLLNALQQQKETYADAVGEGRVRIVRTRQGIAVGEQKYLLAWKRNEAYPCAQCCPLSIQQASIPLPRPVPGPSRL